MKNKFYSPQSGAVIIGSMMLVFGLLGCTVKGESNEKSNNTNVSIAATAEFRTGMRVLWEDHIVWTRNVIECLVDGLPGTENAVDRLLQNQDDIGNAIKPYYGEEAGNKLSKLLKAHINIAADVVNAAKSGNETALKEANNKWHDNADEISAFLSTANPAWKLDDMKMMMNDHLKLTTDEAVQRIKKNYAADVKAFDKVQVEILKMADMLSDGIVTQFPDKFTVEPAR